jgi:hypothetical protein
MTPRFRHLVHRGSTRVCTSARLPCSVILSRARISATVSKDLASPFFRRHDLSENANANQDTQSTYSLVVPALYIGVTNNLARRIYEHKHGLVSGFTSKYPIHRLVYVEEFGRADEAIAREKQLKGWSRRKK